MDMTVRVRRAAMAGAMLAAGTLVTASVSLGSNFAGGTPNLNFRLAQQGGASLPVAIPGLPTTWAVRGEPRSARAGPSPS